MNRIFIRTHVCMCVIFLFIYNLKWVDLWWLCTKDEPKSTFRHIKCHQKFHLNFIQCVRINPIWVLAILWIYFRIFVLNFPFFVSISYEMIPFSMFQEKWIVFFAICFPPIFATYALVQSFKMVYKFQLSTVSIQINRCTFFRNIFRIFYCFVNCIQEVCPSFRKLIPQFDHNIE